MRSKIRYSTLSFNALVSIVLCAATLLWGYVFYFSFFQDYLRQLKGISSILLLLLVGVLIAFLAFISFLNLNKSFRFVIIEGRIVRVHYRFSQRKDYTLNLQDMDGYCIQRYQKEGVFLKPLKKGSMRIFLKKKNDLYFLIDSLYVSNSFEMQQALNAVNLQESEQDVVLDKKEGKRAWRGEIITITGEENDAVILESKVDDDYDHMIDGIFGLLESDRERNGDENIESEVDNDSEDFIDGDFELFDSD